MRRCVQHMGARTPYSEHRFPAPPSKLCQIWSPPVKGSSLSPRSCLPTRSRPPKGFSTNEYLNTLRLLKQHSVQACTLTRGASAPGKKKKGKKKGKKEKRKKHIYKYIFFKEEKRKKKRRESSVSVQTSLVHVTNLLPFEHQRKTSLADSFSRPMASSVKVVVGGRMS